MAATPPTRRKTFPIAASVLAIVLASAPSSVCETESSDDHVWTPDSAVAHALAHHPELLEKRLRAEETEHRVREAWSGALPEIEALASGSRARDPGLLNSPNFEDFAADFGGDFLRPIAVTTYDWRVRVEQILYAFGRVSKAVTAAESNGNRVDLEVRDLEHRIARDARRACYRLALALARERVILAEQESLERAVEQAEDFLEIGTGTRLQVLQAKAALAATRPSRLEVAGEIRGAREALNVAIGGKPLSPASVPAELLETAALPELPELEALVRRSRARPSLSALRANGEFLETLESLERSEVLPEVRFAGSYGRTAIDAENVLDSLYASWDVGVYFSWTLYDGGASRARARQRASQQLQNGQTLRARFAETASALVSSVAAYRQALESRRAAAEAVAQSEEARRVAIEERRWGAATVLDVLEAERTLALSRFRRVQATYDALVALEEIRYGIGLDAGSSLDALVDPEASLEAGVESR